MLWAGLSGTLSLTTRSRQDAAALESINFIGDVHGCGEKLSGPRIRRYESQNTAEIGDNPQPFAQGRLPSLHGRLAREGSRTASVRSADHALLNGGHGFRLGL